MIEFLRDIAIALVPQPETSEPRHVYRWRQTTAVTLMAIGGVSAIHIAWACGYLAFAGMPGFAQAGELKTAQMQLSEIRIAQLERSIHDAKVANCIAQAEGNVEALRYSSDDLVKSLGAYFLAAGHPYPRVPECSELIASARPAR